MSPTFRQIVLAILAISLPVAAAFGALPRVHALDCPSCSKAQLEALAKNCDEGFSYISDFPDAKFYKVCYTSDRNGQKHFQWQQPETEYMKVFQAYENVYRLNGHKQSVHAIVHADIPMPRAAPAEPSSSGH